MNQWRVAPCWIVLAVMVSGCSGHNGREAARAIAEVGGTLLIAAAAAAIEESRRRNESGIADEGSSGGSMPVSDVCEWSCALADGDTQIVRADTSEGARSVCLRSNDVDPSGPECRCIPISPPEWACE